MSDKLVLKTLFGALQEQMISKASGFEKMTVQDYNSFLETRRKLMAEKIKEYYFSL